MTAWPRRAGQATGQWIVKDVLRPGGLLSIAGPRGVQKSMVLIDLALSIAGGDKWLQYYEVGTVGKVIYIFNEGSDEDYQERFWSIAVAKYGEDHAADVLDNVLARSDPFFYTSPSDMKALERFIVGSDPVMSIVDVLRSALRPNKNYAAPLMSDDCAADLLGQLRDLGLKGGAGHAYANHWNKKDSDDPRDRHIGATAWYDKPEAALDLTFTDETRRHVRIHHQLRTAPLPELVMEMPKEQFTRERPFLFRAAPFGPAARKSTPPPTPDVIKPLVLSFLRAASAEVKLSAITGGIHIPNSRAVVVEVLTAMIEQGVVVERVEEKESLATRKGTTYVKKDLEHWYQLSTIVMPLEGL